MRCFVDQATRVSCRAVGARNAPTGDDNPFKPPPGSPPIAKVPLFVDPA